MYNLKPGLTAGEKSGGDAVCRNDGVTAVVDIGGACDNGIPVDYDKMVDDTACWRPLVDDGVKASEINQK